MNPRSSPAPGFRSVKKKKFARCASGNDILSSNFTLVSIKTMKNQQTIFCGLDLQKDNISFVNFSVEEQAIKDVFLRRVSPLDAGDSWQRWRKELAAMKSGVKTYANSLVCGLPSEFAHIKFCLVDKAEKDPEDAIAWEIGQQINGFLDDYVIDHQKMPDSGAGTKKFLTVAYRKSLVEQTADMLRSVKLSPVIFDLDVFGLVNIFEANYPEKLDEASLLVHSEPHMTKLALTRNGAFVDFHAFAHSDEESLPDLLSKAIAGFLSEQQKEDGELPGNTYLAGSVFSTIVERESFLDKIPRSKILDPFRKIPCHAPVDEQHLKESAPQLAVAAGLAVRGKEVLFD
jgi:Tfp pilus assembly PilM family ATPase